MAGVTEEQLQAMVDQQDELDSTVYRFETEAQDHERTFVLLWDRLREGKPWEVLSKFHFERLRLGSLSEWEPLGLGVSGMRRATLDGEFQERTHDEYLVEIKKFEDAGWQVAQTEWHHSTFRPRRRERPASSVVSFVIHAQHSDKQRRLQIEGELAVTWSELKTWDKTPYPDTIEVRKAVIIDQTGKPLFAPWLKIDPREVVPKAFPRVSPVLVYDLDGDGLSEVVLAGCNVLFKKKAQGDYEAEPFLREFIMPLQEAGILADFNGDGSVDFLSSGQKEKKLRMWPGGENGGFHKSSSVVFESIFEHPHVMTAADVDSDGDLDLFIGQWRQPYERGSMPTPYYDARDGHPDYLLLNDGTGQFSDATEVSGLSDKRGHRTFSASLADLDQDGDPDLLTVADFSGLDVFRNDGTGKFTDVTSDWINERHGFGMSHVLDDFDGDGRQDLYMVGMSSTTARRLDRLGIRRDGFEKHDDLRAAMTYGNRMYLQRDGKFVEPVFRDDMARTGWSWGSASADFDNDGDRDLYVANGHLSGKSARDYCTRFWCHDVYTGDSNPSPTLHAFYSTILGEGGWEIGKTVSWNGFEHNHLFLNDGGKGFRNVGFLTGSAFEFDARAVLATDLDADGRTDLLVGRYDTATYAFQLHVLRNQSETTGNWVGVRLKDAPGRSVLGAVVTVTAGGRTWSRQIVTGDSFTAQHPPQVHFGLGEVKKVERIDVRWPNGTTASLDAPASGKYHLAMPSNP